MRWKYIWVTSESDLSKTERDTIKRDTFYSDEVLLLKHIWITFESDLNKMSESNLNQIWVRSEQKKDEMQFNVMIYRWDWNTFELNLSQI